MTRLASILGVATVATLVLLSGCEQAVKTDYAGEKLVGAWTIELDRMVPGNPTDPMSALVDAKTTVTATITAGDKANTGGFALAISDVVASPAVAGPGISVSGTIEVDASEIEVTITGILPEGITAADSRINALTQTPQTLTYKLMASELKVSSPLLPILLGEAHTELTLTKQ